MATVVDQLDVPVRRHGLWAGFWSRRAQWIERVRAEQRAYVAGTLCLCGDEKETGESSCIGCRAAP